MGWQVRMQRRGEFRGRAIAAEDLFPDQLDLAEGKGPAAAVALLHLLHRHAGAAIHDAREGGVERWLAV